MRATVYDQFLSGGEVASALLYLALGFVIAWNLHGMALMVQGILARTVVAMVLALASAVVFSLFALFSIGVLGFMLLTHDPRTSILDIVLLFGAVFAVSIYCWRVERAKESQSGQRAF